ncbi:MAG TPA: hypothetical protein VHV26_10430, partial [Rhizomicrobium sp.]|nr:hypothetical protein [Rhizomicrobium sp.]
RRALYQVPMPDGKTSTDSYKLTVHMDDEGRIDSESSSTGTGDFATPMRQLGVLLQGDNGKKLALALLQKSRTPLATGAFMVEPPDVERSQYKISATYAPPGPMEPLAAGTKFELGDNLKLLNPLGDIFYGPVMNPKFKAADLVPCYSGHSIDDETLEFPSTRHLDRLPDDANVRTQHITYSSHWSQTPGSVNVHREFEARFEEPLCNAMIRDEVQAALVRIRADAAAASFAVPRN